MVIAVSHSVAVDACQAVDELGSGILSIPVERSDGCIK
jgi:hypothetical protein